MRFYFSVASFHFLTIYFATAAVTFGWFNLCIIIFCPLCFSLTSSTKSIEQNLFCSNMGCCSQLLLGFITSIWVFFSLYVFKVTCRFQQTILFSLFNRCSSEFSDGDIELLKTSINFTFFWAFQILTTPNAQPAAQCGPTTVTLQGPTHHTKVLVRIKQIIPNSNWNTGVF